MKYIDLSMEVTPNPFDPVSIAIHTISHQAGADLLGETAGITHQDFPGQMGLSLEQVSLSTHTGTHIDAPHHYGPFCQNQAAKKISDLPLVWFNQPGVVLSCVGNRMDGPIDSNEVKAALAAISYQLKPLDIVLIHTGADKLQGTKAYFENFRGMTADAIKFLVSNGIKVIGIDSFSMDAPFDDMLSTYLATKCHDALWPAHIIGRQHEYCQIERLVNLDNISKPFGFQVICFPVKLYQCDAAWCRAVAIEEAL